MSITVKSVCQDTWNFFHNQLSDFLLIALLCACITVAFRYFFLPSTEQIALLMHQYHLGNSIRLFEVIENMTFEQKKILLRFSFLSSLSLLISNTILTGSTLTLVKMISKGHHISAFQAIFFSATLLPKLFILIFLTTMLVQMGVILLILPGIPLAIIFSLSPILVVQNTVGVLTAMRNSIQLVWKNINLVSPAVMILLLAKILLILFFPINYSGRILNTNIILLNIISNIFSEVLLIYLFRLYMLISK